MIDDGGLHWSRPEGLSETPVDPVLRGVAENLCVRSGGVPGRACQDCLDAVLAVQDAGPVSP